MGLDIAKKYCIVIVIHSTYGSNTMQAMRKEQILSVRTPKDLIEKANYHAQAQDLSTSQVVRKLLREWVDEQDKKHRKQLSIAE